MTGGAIESFVGKAPIVRDVLFPSDNRWGVPCLIPSCQPEMVEIPFRGWGTVARRKERPGCWHFYVDDYRFSALELRPDQLPWTKPLACTEPNYSLFDETPYAAGIFAIYRKRWLARYWQERGVPVYVDLNVPRKFLKMNMLGVPQGWRAFSTRGYEKGIGDAEAGLANLSREYKLAYEWSNGRPLMVVFGGGKRVRAFCQSKGIHHIKRGSEGPKGEGELSAGQEGMAELGLREI